MRFWLRGQTLYANMAALFLGGALCLAKADAEPVQTQETDAPAKAISFSKPLQFSYLSWEGKVKVEGGKAILKDLKTDGGGGVSEKLDLSAKANWTPALKLKAGPANTAKTIRIQLLDSAGAAARWEFRTPKASDSFELSPAKHCASFEKPNEAEDKSKPDEPVAFDLSKTVQWQLLGDWQSGTLDLEVEGVWALPPDKKIIAAREAESKRLVSLDAPSLFSYGAWEKKVKIDGAKLALNGIGTNGGMGANENMDLTEKAASIPALRIRTGAGNSAKVIILQLWDENDVAARWEFHLPPPSDAFTTLTEGNAPLCKPPREQDKVKGTGVPSGSFDLSKVKGWQITGNWQPGVLDLEIEELMLLPPDPKTIEERKGSAKELAAQAKQRREEAKARRAEQEKTELKKQYSTRGPKSPELTNVSLVASDVIALTIEAQKVVLAKFEKYVPQAGDEKQIEKWKDGVVRRARLIRDGKDAGWLQGRNLDWLSSHEGLEGDPFLYFLAENPANYEVSSEDDPVYATPQRPVAVYRKSVPIDWQADMNKFPMRHNVYLKMDRGLTPGKSYKVAIAELNIKNPEAAKFVYDSRKLRSDAVHSNQIGFRPDDPGKRAFLSMWLGTGGPLSYPEGMRFSIIDEASGKDVFNGPLELAFAKDRKTEHPWNKTGKNDTGTAVYKMDFGDLKTPGRYRVHVEGLGCGYPFEISPSAWEKAFLVQMRGFFHNRSGVELGEPYTTFKKPRDFHPADGAVVTRTTNDVFLKVNENCANIAKGDTGEPVPDAWGGYHDAGDWNPRRASHLAATMAQLEAYELYPAYFGALKLKIPPTEGLPDVLTEALFEIDCFRRLQLPDGGVSYGIETDGDPSPGEISWLSTQRAYVPPPNIRDTWHYAAAAARVSRLLKPLKPELAEVYLNSALKAFAWAEADYQKRKADGSLSAFGELWRAVDHRNFSALLLYEITGERKYHEIFLQDSCVAPPTRIPFLYGKWVQCDAAFFYARMDESKTDPAIRKNAIDAIMSQGDFALSYAAGNAFNIATEERGRPLFGCYFSASGGTALVRAHYLSGKPEYLTGLVRSCQFQSGCNPNNIVYTSGLGANPVKHPLHLDSRSTGQAPPEGLTTFGNVDYWNWKGGFWDWPIPFISKSDGCFPHPYDWPLDEAYFDINLFISMDEFTVDNWAPNVLVWGYLAARPKTP